MLGSLSVTVRTPISHQLICIFISDLLKKIIDEEGNRVRTRNSKTILYRTEETVNADLEIHSNLGKKLFHLLMTKKDSKKMSNINSAEIEEIEKVLFSLENDPPDSLPLDIFENSNSSIKSDADADDSEDDIKVVKADIYKFHGQEETSLDQQISEGILKFEYRQGT